MRRLISVLLLVAMCISVFAGCQTSQGTEALSVSQNSGKQIDSAIICRVDPAPDRGEDLPAGDTYKEPADAEIPADTAPRASAAVNAEPAETDTEATASEEVAAAVEVVAVRAEEEPVPDEEPAEEVPAEEVVEVAEETPETPAEEAVEVVEEIHETPAEEAVEVVEEIPETPAEETAEVVEETPETPAEETVEVEEEIPETPVEEVVEDDEEIPETPAEEIPEEPAVEDAAPAAETAEASAGAEVVDLTDKLNALMEKDAAALKKFEEKYGYYAAAAYYYIKVTDGGDWDIKRTDEWKFEEGKTYVYNGQEMRMDDPGNIHFGYVGAVLFPEEFVCFGAGMNNFFKFGTRDGDFSSYFDDPQDQEMMKLGYSMYVEENE